MHAAKATQAKTAAQRSAPRTAQVMANATHSLEGALARSLLVARVVLGHVVQTTVMAMENVGRTANANVTRGSRGMTVV